MMLDHYLSTAAAPPRQVVLFISKDYLNLHGYRADVSVQYKSLLNIPSASRRNISCSGRPARYIVQMAEDASTPLQYNSPRLVRCAC